MAADSSSSNAKGGGAMGVQLHDLLSTLEQQFTLRKEKLLELTHHFAELYTYGLSTKGADMPMIPSFGE